MLKRILHTIYSVLSSRRFFLVIIGLFIVEAAWFALTAQYPMAFDENYHFGIIQIYSHQWLPFITKVPPGSGIYGNLTRYDSYMYHYLMSFPYRFITLFIHSEIVQIIILRFINIGLFVGGLFLFRKLLRRVHISEGISNLSFLMFILVPIVPFLAATINYDNLTFLMVPVLAGLALTCAQALRDKKRSIPPVSFILLLAVGGLSSLIKYAFLPVFLAVILYLLVLYIRTPGKKELWKAFGRAFLKIRRPLQIILIIFALISAGLFIERYGVNLVKYHSIEPDCSRLQSLNSCLEYGPYARNYNHKQLVASGNAIIDPPIIFFIPVWIGGMMYRLFFAINYDYSNYSPLPLPLIISSLIGAFGIVLSIIYRRFILRIDRHILLLLAIIFVYTLSLFYDNFIDYLQYKTPLAVNGRYLVLVLPLIFPIIAISFKQFFQKVFKSRAGTALIILAVASFVLMLDGGGALTQIDRANAYWYIDNPPVVQANLAVKKALYPVILGSGVNW